MEKRIEVNKDKLVEWFKVKGLSKKSIANYLFYFNKFDFEKLDQDSIVTFLNRFNNPVARAFLSNVIQYIKMGDFPQEIKGLMFNIEVPKVTGRKKHKQIEVLSREEIHDLAKAMKNKREKFMVLLSFYAGLRLSELINLKPYDFNWNSWLKRTNENGRLKVIGKGNKERVIPIIPELMREMYDWIKSDVSNKQDTETSLFKIGGRRWQVLLAINSKKVLKRAINPHLLRHSTGSYLREQGLDLKEIAEFLGHDSIITTQIYTQINKEKLGKKVQAAFKF